MKFTKSQIEEIARLSGISQEGAVGLATLVASMCADRIRGDLAESDPTGLEEGDAHAEGMERAASLLDSD